MKRLAMICRVFVMIVWVGVDEDEDDDGTGMLVEQGRPSFHSDNTKQRETTRSFPLPSCFQCGFYPSFFQSNV